MMRSHPKSNDTKESEAAKNHKRSTADSTEGFMDSYKFFSLNSLEETGVSNASKKNEAAKTDKHSNTSVSSLNSLQSSNYQKAAAALEQVLIAAERFKTVKDLDLKEKALYLVFEHLYILSDLCIDSNDDFSSHMEDNSNKYAHHLITHFNQASVDSQYERREHPAQPSPLRIQH